MKQHNFRREADEYLDWSLGKPTSPHVNEFAAWLGLTPSNLSRRFRRQVGVHPSKYLKRQHVLRTVKMIKTTDAGYREIARKMGWGSVTTMFRSIRRVTGRTAESFRRKRRRRPVKK